MIYNNTTVNSKGSREYGIVNIEPGHTTLSETPQYLAIKEANKKIKTYAPIIDSLDWQGARTIMTTSPDIGLSYVLLDSLYVPFVTNPSLYQGYVQVGLYTDPYDTDPYLMLVNRRANVAPYNLSTIGPGTDNLTAYNLACSQDQVDPHTVRLFPSSEASCFGTFIGFYDPYDSTLYKQSGVGSAIDLPIEPGDGRLIEMVGTLPYSVTTDAVIKQTGYMNGNISIQDNVDVIFQNTSDVTLLPNTHLTIGSGSSLTVNGKFKVGENSTISVNNGGSLYINLHRVGFADTVVVFENNSKIDILAGAVNLEDTEFDFRGNSHITNNSGALSISNSTFTFGSGYIKCFSASYPDYLGTLHISNSTFDKHASAVGWVGIWTHDASEVSIENSVISNAVNGIRSENTNVFVYNTKFYIPTHQYNGNFSPRYGIKVANEAPGKIVQVSADDSTCGFFGLDGVPDPLDLKTGLYVHGCNTQVRGVKFLNLHYGIELIAAFGANDSISFCNFNDCATGIYTLSGYNSGTISYCVFTQIDTENQMIGINMLGSSPAVKNCGFYNLRGSGIITFQSAFIKQDGIYQCDFYNCGSVVNGEPRGAAIESSYANNLVTGSTFNQNVTGILNHTQSNLNLTHMAHNVFNNKFYNIKFSEFHPYQAWIQLYKGHNDFHRYIDPETHIKNYDFCFDTNYFQDYPLDVIKADGNWFQNNAVKVFPDSLSYYVVVNEFDPFPNSTGFLGEGRFFTALDYEYNQQFSAAIDLYKQILDDPLPEEKPFLGSCSDGIFRIAFYENYPVTQSIDYFNEKVLQYVTTEPYLSKLLQAYLLKEFIIGKDFQAAIDLLLPRIDNPVSAIDSLRAVLDIELILQLAALDETKKPLVITCPQYRYADIPTFTKKHDEHWNMMLALLNNGQTEEIPLPVNATLYQNYPNPFNPSTTIKFAIPKDSPVTICIYNIKGQLVRKLCHKDLKKGYHNIVWDGRDEIGREACSGLYLIRLSSETKTVVRKAMLLK